MPNDVVIPRAAIDEIEGLLDSSRPLDAYERAKSFGAFEESADPHSLLVGGRLLRHLGARARSNQVTSRAYRAMPHSLKALTQRLYQLEERRSLLGCWQFCQRFESATHESEGELAEAMVARARIYTRFRDYSTAIQLIDKATKLAPASPWVWCGAGHYWLAQNDYERGLEFTNYSLSCWPHYRAAVMTKGEILQSLGRKEEAIDFLESERAYGQNFAISYALAIDYNLAQNFERALECLDESENLAILADESSRDHSLSLRVEILVQLEEWEKVDALFRDDVPWMLNIRKRLKESSGPNIRVRLPVPYIMQDHKTCAPATLSALTSFWNRMIPQETLIQDICYDGTPHYAERQWLEKNGWLAREFKVTWDTAVELLNRNIPFSLSTMAAESAHVQAVVGYDSRLKRLLFQDSNIRHYRMADWDELEKDQACNGPRGLVIVPKEEADLISAISLPEEALYDLYYQFNLALKEHRRSDAEQVVAEMDQAQPGHRLGLTARRCLAGYDENHVSHLQVIGELLADYPEDPSLLRCKYQLLILLGDTEAAEAVLQTVCAGKKAPDFFLRERGRLLGMDARNKIRPLLLLRRSLARNPVSAAGLSTFAGILWGMDERDLAIEIQRLAVCCEDKDEAVVNGFMRMMVAMGQRDRVVQFMKDRFILLGDKSSGPGLSYVSCLESSQLVNEARAALDEALKLRPGDGLLLLQAASYRLREGDIQGCRALLDEAENKTPRVQWLRQRVRAANLMGDFVEEEKASREWVNNAPLNMEAHNMLISILFKKEGQKLVQTYVKGLGTRFPHHAAIIKTEISWLSKDEPDYISERLQNFVNSHPQNAWAYREMALWLLGREKKNEALEWAQYAKSMEPKNSGSWCTEGAVLEKLGRIEEARNAYREAIYLDVDTIFAINHLFSLPSTRLEGLEDLRFFYNEITRQVGAGPAVQHYREKGFRLVDPEELLTHLRQFTKDRPELWQAWDALFEQLMALQDIEESYAVAAEMIKRFPVYPACWRKLAKVQILKGDLKGAKASQLKGLSINPDYVELIGDHAQLLKRDKQISEAESFMLRCQERNPNNSVILGLYARFLIEIHQNEKATECLSKALDLDHNYNWAWNQLAPHYALTKCEALLAKHPNDYNLLIRYSQLIPKREADLPKKVEHARRAVELEPFELQAHLNYVDQLLNANRWDEALAACKPEAFLTKIPPELALKEIVLNRHMGKRAESMEALKTFLQTEVNHYQALDVMRDWLTAEKKYKECVEIIDRLIRLNPLSAQLYYQRGITHSLLNDTNQAIDDIKKSLHVGPSQQGLLKLFELLTKERKWEEIDKALESVTGQISEGYLISIRFCHLINSGKAELAGELLVKNATREDLDSMILDAFPRLPYQVGKKVCFELTKSILDPQLNWWVLRCWKLFDQKKNRLVPLLKKLPANYRAKNMLFFLIVTFEVAEERNRPLLDWMRSKYPQECELTDVWGAIGAAYLKFNEFERAANYLKDWEKRKGLDGYELGNLVIALQVLGKRDEANKISERVLAEGLTQRTESTYYHSFYLTLSALEDDNLERAEKYFPRSDHARKILLTKILEQSLAIFQAKGYIKKDAAFSNAWKNLISRVRKEKRPSRKHLDIYWRILSINCREAKMNIVNRLWHQMMYQMILKFH